MISRICFFFARLVFVGWLSVWSGQSLLAQDGRKEAFRFVETPSDARLSALGGHHAAILQIHSGAYRSNPAFIADGLKWKDSGENPGVRATGESKSTSIKPSSWLKSDWSAGLSTGTLPAGITLAGIHAQKSIEIQGQSVMLLSGIHGLLYGEMDRRAESGEIMGSFRSHDLEWSLAGATRLTERISFGLTASLLASQYDEYRSSALSLKAGLYWKSAQDQTAVGVVLRNAGWQMARYLSVKESLPVRFSVGITHKPTYFPARLMATWVDDLHANFKPDWLIGTEFLLGDPVRFRLGYNHRTHTDLKSASRIDLSGVQAGLGITVKEWTIDLSRSSWGRLGGVFQIGISR